MNVIMKCYYLPFQYVQYVPFTAAISINLILGLTTNVYILWLIVTRAVGMMASDFFSLNLDVNFHILLIFPLSR